jgi:hypothetical protein
MRALSMADNAKGAVASLEAQLRDVNRSMDAMRQRGRPDQVAYYENQQKLYNDALNMVRGGNVTPSGSMYEVGINADPNTFLDWDKLLSEQPEPVRRALGVGDRWDHDVEMARFEALAKERGVLVGELPEFAAAEERFLAAAT